MHKPRRILDVLTPEIVAKSLDMLERDIPKYLWLQGRFAEKTNLSKDADFQRKFNGYYRVRRNENWRNSYFNLMENLRYTSPSFREILVTLQNLTGNLEASFSSKMLATIDPHSPVIDTEVFRKLNFRLPAYSTPDRLDGVCGIFDKLVEQFTDTLGSTESEKIIGQFDAKFPQENITNIKKLDLLLWQAKI